MESLSNFTQSYTRNEVNILVSFKEYCASKNLEYRFDLYPNEFLIKFLRSKNYKMEETYQKFIKYLKFAKEYQIEHINEVQFPNIDKIKIFYPHNFHKTTKTGHPIFLQNLGELKINDINKLLPDKKLIQYITFLLEKMRNNIFPKCSLESKKNIDRVFCIVDLLGLTTSLMNKKVFDFLNQQLTICQNYYPGILEGLYFVNTGLIFRALWASCKYFYDEDTRNRIKLLGFDYKPTLLEKVNPKNLPKLIGGECNCEPYGCFFSDLGPWSDNNNKQNIKARSKTFMEMINDEKTNEIYEKLKRNKTVINELKVDEDIQYFEGSDVNNVNSSIKPIKEI